MKKVIPRGILLNNILQASLISTHGNINFTEHISLWAPVARIVASQSSRNPSYASLSVLLTILECQNYVWA